MSQDRLDGSIGAVHSGLPVATETFKRLAKAHGRVCWYCGAKKNLEVDHRNPRVVGGSDDDANLSIACRRCNKTKNGQTVEQFRALVAVRLGVKTICFFGESGVRLKLPPSKPIDRSYWRSEGKPTILLLAIEAQLDPRTVARVMVEGTSSLKSYYARLRLVAVAKKLGIDVPSTATEANKRK
jgi:hypothetical protein